MEGVLLSTIILHLFMNLFRIEPFYRFQFFLWNYLLSFVPVKQGSSQLGQYKNTSDRSIYDLGKFVSLTPPSRLECIKTHSKRIELDIRTTNSLRFLPHTEGTL